MSLSISTADVRVQHRAVTVSARYEPFTGGLEKILGRFSADVQKEAANNPDVAAQRIKAMEGEQGLMIFQILDHGAALNIIGARKKAKQYLIGNPLVAIQMTRLDLRAALYAPLRVLVYERAEGQTMVEFEQPSTLLGQFGNAEVTAVALDLDRKLERVIARAAELAGL